MFRTGIIVAALGLAVAVLGTLPAPPDGPDMIPVGPLNVATYEVTVADWKTCVAAGACDTAPVVGVSQQDAPVTGVNAFDVAAYVAWINAGTGRSFRLPTRAEWTAFSGVEKQPERPLLFSDPRLAWAARYGQEVTPKGPVRPRGAWGRSRTGVFDVQGNVWEWTSSCIDGFADAHGLDRCPAFYATGAHEALVSVFVRDPANGGCVNGTPPTYLGFRLVEDRR